MGQFGKWAVDISVLGCNLGVCAGYMIFISSNLQVRVCVVGGCVDRSVSDGMNVKERGEKWEGENMRGRGERGEGGKRRTWGEVGGCQRAEHEGER